MQAENMGNTPCIIIHIAGLHAGCPLRAIYDTESKRDADLAKLTGKTAEDILGDLP